MVGEFSILVWSIKETEYGLNRSENPDISNDKYGVNPYRRKDKVS